MFRLVVSCFILNVVCSHELALGMGSGSSRRNSPEIYQDPNTSPTITLFNSQTSSEGLTIYLDSIEIQEAKFRTLSETIIFNSFSYVTVHGFLTGYENEWAYQLKDQLLAAHDSNVFIVEWCGLTEEPNSFTDKDVRKAGILADLIANFFNRQILPRLNYSKMHFLGHSIGARIANYAIMRIDGRISHLTALDPFFKQPPSDNFPAYFLPGEYELYLSRPKLKAAKFTTVVHTDSNNLSIATNCGSIDVFLNGGANQPGCYRANQNQAFAHITNCNHDFASKFFRSISNFEIAKAENLDQETLDRQFIKEKDKCFPIAYKCSSYNSFLKGYCGVCRSRRRLNARSTCVYVGLPGPMVNHSSEPESLDLWSIYSLATDEQARCMFLYRIIVGVQRDSRVISQFNSDFDNRIFLRIPLSEQPHHSRTIRLSKKNTNPKVGEKLRDEFVETQDVIDLYSRGLTYNFIDPKRMDYRSTLLGFKSKTKPEIKLSVYELSKPLEDVEFVEVWGLNIKVQFIAIDYLSHPYNDVRRQRSFLATRQDVVEERIGQDLPFFDYFATFSLSKNALNA